MPGTSVGDLLVRLGINVNGFTQGLTTAEKALEHTGTRMYFLGSRIAIGFGAPLAIAMGAVAKFGLEFDKAMTESLAIMSDVSPQIRQEMEATAQSIARTTKFSAVEAAQAYYGLASAGYTAQESMSNMPVVARFAQAGVMDLARATDLLAAAQNAMGMKIDGDVNGNMREMARISDVLTEANNRALGTVQQFAEALTNKAGNALRFVNKSIEEGVAVLAVYHQQNIMGKLAGQQLSMVLRDLEKSFAKNREEWDRLNISVFDSQGKMRNMADIVDEVTKAMSKMTDEQKLSELRTLGFQDRARHAMLALLGFGDSIRQMEGYLKAAGGTTEEVANKQMQALTNQLLRLRNQGVNLLIDIFNEFAGTLNNFVIPVLQDLLDAGRGLVAFFKSLPQIFKDVIAGVALFLAALGPMVFTLGSAQLAWKALLATLRVAGGGLATAATRIGALGWASQAAALATEAAAVKAAKASGKWSSFGLLFLDVASRQRVSRIEAERLARTMTGALPVFEKTAKSVYGVTPAFVGFGGTIARFFTHPVVAATAVVGALGLAIYAFAKTSKSELQKELESDANAFFKLTTRMREATRELTNVSAKRFYYLTISQDVTPFLEDLAKATAREDELLKTLAPMLGLTAEEMRREMDAGTDLIGVLNRLATAREREQNARLAELTAESQRINALIEEYKQKIVELSKLGTMVPTATPGGAPVFGVVKTPVTEQNQVQLIEEARRTLEGLYEARAKLGRQDVALSSTGERDPRLGPRKKSQAEIDAEIAEREAQTKAYQNQVNAMRDLLAGEGKKSLDVLKDAWKGLSVSERENADTVERLWEQYKKLRPELDVSMRPKDIEAATAGLRAIDEALEVAAMRYGDVYQSMAGATSAGDRVLDQMPQIQQAYRDLNGNIDPQWILANADAWDELLLQYDQLPPELQAIITTYLRLKEASRMATSTAVADAQALGGELSQTAAEIDAALADKRTELAAFTINVADKEFIGLKKGLEAMKLEHNKTFAAMVTKAREISWTGNQVLNEAAARDILTFRERATEIERIEERLGYVRVATSLGVDRAVMTSFLRLTDKQKVEYLRLIATIDELRIKAQAWTDAMQNVGGVLSGMGLEGVGSSIARIGSSMFSAYTAGLDFKKSLDIRDQVKSFTAGMAAVASAIQGAQTAMEGAVSGAMSGAAMGSAWGGWGAAIGAIAGGIAGWFSGSSKEAARLRQELEQLRNTVLDTVGGMQNLTAAGAVFGVSTAEFATASKLELQLMNSSLTYFIDQLKSDLTDASRLASTSLLDTIARARELGFELAEIDEWTAKQYGAIGEGALGLVNAFAAPWQRLKDQFDAAAESLKNATDPDEIAKLTAEMELLSSQMQVSQTDFDRYGRILSQAFAASMVGGQSFFSTLTTLSPALAQLQSMMEGTGLVASGTLQTLLGWNQLTTVMPELATALDSLNAMTRGLWNTGMLTEQMFNDLGMTAVEIFQQMTLHGRGGEQGMRAMQPTLQQLWQIWKDTGWAIDEATQQLLIDAEAAGIVGDKFKTEGRKQLDALEAVKTLLGDLTTFFREDFVNAIVEAFRKAEQAAVDAGRVIDRELERPRRVTVTYPGGEGGGGGGTVPALAHGGVVMRPTMALVGERGPEAVLPLSALPDRGGRGGGTVILKIGPRTLAEILVPEIPGVVQEYGLG